jgi:RNA polymerase sigma-70 factor (ECF subfamily)
VSIEADAAARARQMAFADLIGGRLDAACRLAAVVLGNSADAEDAVQDAAIRAWQHSDDLRDSRRFDAWFDRIVLNVCRDRFRGRRLRPTSVLDLAEIGAADQTESVVRADALTQAILTLTPEHRTVVALRYLTDLSPEEIAARTGSRTGTVKSRLHYALRELRAAYDADAR